MKVSKATSAKHHDELLKAASRLFRERGFDKVGIAEIAAAAGLTHGAFYTHFESKEDESASRAGVCRQHARSETESAAGRLGVPLWRQQEQQVSTISRPAIRRRQSVAPSGSTSAAPPSEGCSA